MSQIKDWRPSACHPLKMWNTIETPPSHEDDVQLAVIDADGEHALVFPCRMGTAGWVQSDNGLRVFVLPTHWRLWSDRTDQPTAEVALAG